MAGARRWKRLPSPPGVSRGTASRALSGGKNVSPRALEAVGKAAAELGYRPNLAARSLVLRRSGAIGLVVSESWDRVFAQPYFADIVRGVNDELGESGTQLLLAIVRDDDERRHFARFGAGIHLDGALLVSFAADDAFPETLETAGVPVVAAGRGEFVRYSVDVDNRGGARRAVDHLIAGGRRRIATIAGPGELAVSTDRLEGWRDALVAAGLDPSPELVEVGDYAQASGRARGRAPARAGARHRRAVRRVRPDGVRRAARRYRRRGAGCPTTSPWSGSTTCRPPPTRSRR